MGITKREGGGLKEMNVVFPLHKSSVMAVSFVPEWKRFSHKLCYLFSVENCNVLISVLLTFMQIKVLTFFSCYCQKCFVRIS